MNPLKMTALETEQAYACWDEILAPLFQKAIDIGPKWDDIHGLKADLARGASKVFIFWDPLTGQVSGALYCEGEEQRLCRVLRISYCGGVEIEHWIHLYAAVRHWAVENGFTQIAFCGRRAWKKLLAQYVSEDFTHYIDEMQDLQLAEVGNA